jgi:hypothetical protein
LLIRTLAGRAARQVSTLVLVDRKALAKGSH